MGVAHVLSEPPKNDCIIKPFIRIVGSLIQSILLYDKVIFIFSLMEQVNSLIHSFLFQA